MDNEKLLLEIWQNFRDMLPAKSREDAALSLLKSFEEYSFDINPADLIGEDEYLDAALEINQDDEDPEMEEI